MGVRGMGFVGHWRADVGLSAVHSTKETQGVSQHSSLEGCIFRQGEWRTRQQQNVAALSD